MISRWLSFDSRQKAVLQSIVQDKTKIKNATRSVFNAIHVLYNACNAHLGLSPNPLWYRTLLNVNVCDLHWHHFYCMAYAYKINVLMSALVTRLANRVCGVSRCCRLMAASYRFLTVDCDRGRKRASTRVVR